MNILGKRPQQKYIFCANKTMQAIGWRGKKTVPVWSYDGEELRFFGLNPYTYQPDFPNLQDLRNEMLQLMVARPGSYLRTITISAATAYNLWRRGDLDIERHLAYADIEGDNSIAVFGLLHVRVPFSDGSVHTVSPKVLISPRVELRETMVEMSFFRRY